MLCWKNLNTLRTSRCANRSWAHVRSALLLVTFFLSAKIKNKLFRIHEYIILSGTDYVTKIYDISVPRTGHFMVVKQFNYAILFHQNQSLFLIPRIKSLSNKWCCCKFKQQMLVLHVSFPCCFGIFAWQLRIYFVVGGTLIKSFGFVRWTLRSISLV